MKTGNKRTTKILLCVGALLTLTATIVVHAWAQPLPANETAPVATSSPEAPVAPAPAGTPVVAQPASPVMEQPASAMNAPSPVPLRTGSLPTIASPVMPTTAAMAESTMAAPHSVDSAKPVKHDFDSIIQHLKEGPSVGTQSNLNDIQMAQDAISRLDLLLDIEKKLADFEKAQSAVTSAKNAAMPAIPASVLNMPMAPGMAMPGLQSSMTEAARPAMPVYIPPVKKEASADDFVVDRIIGTSHGLRAYMASNANDNPEPYAVGDKIDGWKVSSISTTGVKLTDSKGKTATVGIKVDGVPIALSGTQSND